MKKLLIICAVMLGCIVQAQERGDRHYYREMTPEQIATLGSKRLALALDLSEEQQGTVMELQMRRVIERREKMQERKAMREQKDSLGPEERFDLLNKKLDRQLAYKSDMKNILTEEQYQKWEEMLKGKSKHSYQRRGHHHRRQAKR